MDAGHDGKRRLVETTNERLRNYKLTINKKSGVRSDKKNERRKILTFFRIIHRLMNPMNDECLGNPFHLK